MGQKIRKALVVDDSRLARVALCKQLQKLEIETEVAGNGTEAIAYLKSASPDVVFMDFMMPDMDGFEAAQRVLSDSACAHPPIVMYTSQDTDEDRARAKEVGISAFLSKPSSEDKLTEVIFGIERGDFGAAAPARRAEAPAAEPAPAQPAKLAVAEIPWDQLRSVAREVARLSAADVAKDAAEAAAATTAERVVRDQVQALRAELAERTSGLGEAAQRSAADAARGAARDMVEQAAKAALRQAQEAAQVVAEQTAAQTARRSAEEALRTSTAAAREAVDTRLKALSEGGEFRTLVKGVVFEHALPGIQQAVLPAAQRAAEDAVATARDALQPQFDALQAEIAAVRAALDQAKVAKGKLAGLAVVAGLVAGAVAGYVVGVVL